MPSSGHSKSSYYQSVRRVLLITLFLNLAVVIVKLVVGLMANSLSVVSDAGHSATDSFNNLAGLLVIRWAMAEADEEHPYGHRKFESLAAFSIGGALLVTCFEIAKNALQRLMHPSGVAVDVSRLTIGGVFMSILVNVFVYVYERREGERLQSQYLIADSLHTRSDILISSALLIGLLVIRMGFPRLDPVFALIITGLIAQAGWQIFQRTVPVLVDAAPLEPSRIRTIAMAVAGVKDVYDVRSRSDGDHLFIEFSLSVKPSDVYRAHLVTEEVERRLGEELGSCDVTIHVEPSMWNPGE